jgi:23S rRNA pseudouridine2605 synthase
MTERIAKYLARAGVASRRDIERMIGEGRIAMNGVKIEHPATFVGEADIVLVDGKPIGAPGRTRLWRYHKPPGLVTTHRDPEGRPTVFAALPPDLPRVVSVGRLDLTSEGLLLLTNDGGLARTLELPSTGWLRRYRVRVYGLVDAERLRQLRQGITVDDVRYGPVEAEIEVEKGINSWLVVSLHEGKNREIRRVMEAINLRVTRLIRIAYGPFQLGRLEPGAVEEVNPKVLRDQMPKPKS